MVRVGGRYMELENTDATMFWHWDAWLHWLLMSNDFKALKNVKNVAGSCPTMPLLDKLMSVTSCPVHAMPCLTVPQQLPDTKRFSSLFASATSTHESSTPK